MKNSKNKLLIFSTDYLNENGDQWRKRALENSCKIKMLKN